MSELDIGWIAGIIEGEGSVTLRSNAPGSVVLAVEMQDEDIINRLYQITEVGNITGPYFRSRSRSHHKAMWHWTVHKKKDVARLLLAIYPLMGNRRKMRIEEAVDRLQISLSNGWNKYSNKPVNTIENQP